MIPNSRSSKITSLFALTAICLWKQTTCFQTTRTGGRTVTTDVTTGAARLSSPLIAPFRLPTSLRRRLHPAGTRTFLPSTSAVSSEDYISSLQRSESKEDDGGVEGVGAWIPLGLVSGLTGIGPQRIRIMGIDLVVWHTNPDEKKKKKKKKGKVTGHTFVAQLDACTHRLAPLSQGRVNSENCIECPYHGWNFDTDGIVTSIPQLEENKSIENVRRAGGNVKNFPIHVVGDLIFVFLPSSLHGEMFPQSLLPENMYPYLIHPSPEEVEPMTVRTLPYSLDFLLENFMDPAHIPFAHHKLQGTRDDGRPIPIGQIVSNFTHVELTFKDVSAGRHRDGYLSFQRPSFYNYGEFNKTDETKGKTEHERNVKLKIFCVPVEAGKCRVFLYLPPIKLPTFLLHAGNNRFLNSDVWLHDTEREVVRRKEAGAAGTKPSQMDYVYASKSDAGVSLFRAWWRKHGFADAPADTFGMATMERLGPAALTRAEQIDPWENHARHCGICRRALKRMKMGRNACLFLAVASPFVGRRVPVLGLGGIVLGLFGHNFLTRLATSIEGNPDASGIADRSTSALAD